MMRQTFLRRLDAGDRALFLRLALPDRSSSLRCTTWRAITHLGGACFTIAVALTCLLAGGVWREAGRAILEILVASHLVVQAIKRSVGRPRPSRGTTASTLIAEPDRFSFPSGHAAASMSVALGLSVALPAGGPLLAALAAIVGFSRVALAVHFPGDVAAGQLIALATALALR